MFRTLHVGLAGGDARPAVRSLARFGYCLSYTEVMLTF
jgi:hypothetical protein